MKNNISEPYSKLDPNSKVWIYQSNRMLTDEEAIQIRAAGNAFVEKWTAHDVQLQGAFEIFYNRFIVMVVDETHTMASGCSIDKSLKFIKDLEKQYDLTLLDRMNFAFKDGDEVKSLPRADFEKLYKTGEINRETIVFNNLVGTKAELQSRWEIPLKDSWHLKMVE